MGILEKLRPQPRWKHTDPAVRAGAVYELGPDDIDALSALAREDADARVRRAAMTRIDDVALLGEVAGSDPDEDVRAEAVRGLAGIAAEADDVAQAVEAGRQLLALGRTREIVLVVRDSSSVEVRAVVVDLLDDPKALGSVSRHAPDGSTRLRALARLSDADELLNVALKAEHTDAAVAALERVTEAHALGAIAQRARNKVAARRARMRLKALEEPRQPASAGAALAMSPDDRARATDILHRAEALVAIADPDEATAALAAARLAWAELQADVDIDAALVQRFESAADAAREAIVERQRDRAAEEERARTAAQEQAHRVAICEEIETLAGPAAPDRIAVLKVQWDSLPPMPSEYAASLTRRFQHACRAFEDRERRRILAEAASARLESLATELEQLAASDQALDEVLARWRGLRRDADVLREHGEANPGAAERVERAVAQLEAKEQQHQQERAKQEQDTLRRLQQLCRQLEALMAAEQITLKTGDRALRQIRDALEARAALPSKKDRQEIQTRLEAARRALAPRVQELREADEWQRWANLQVQDDLSREMEALRADEDLERAARRMRELQARWKQVALAPRAQGEARWRRFKAAQEEVFARTAAFFAAQREERASNLARKQDLCARVEALADSTDWVRTAQEIQALQAEWKTVGPVTRGLEKATWERFRAACDRFFTRRHEDLKQRKEAWAANLAKKEALCIKAEALADSTDWDAAAAEIRQSQAAWKTTGPVRRSKSEAVWQRFRAACDRFFERYKHREQVDLLARAAPRETIIRELESLLPPQRTSTPAGDAGESQDGAEPAAPADNLHTIIQQARNRWQQAPEVARHLQHELAARYHQALGRIVATFPSAFAGTDLDPEAARTRMEKLVARVEELVPPRGRSLAQLSSAERLARQWRERLAVNTIAGGRAAAENEETRRRTAEQEIRNAQTQWMRLGPVPPEIAGPLNERFQRACRRFFEQGKRVP